MVSRTTNASSRTAAARPKPISLTRMSVLVMNPAKTEIMISAAATTTRALPENPEITAGRGRSPCVCASLIRDTRKTS